MISRLDRIGCAALGLVASPIKGIKPARFGPIGGGPVGQLVEDAGGEFLVVHFPNPRRAGEAIRLRSGPRRLTPGPAPA